MLSNWEIAQKIQADAKRLEADMGYLVAEKFESALTELQSDLAVLFAKSEGPGGTVYLNQAARMQELEKTIASMEATWIDDIEKSIEQKKAGTIESHLDKYAQSMEAVLPQALRIPELNRAWPKALLALQKRTADGVPLSDKLPPISQEAVAHMMSQLQIGAARGEGTYELMRRVNRVADTGRYRAEVIARNEILMASRQAGDWTYAQYDSVIAGKRRLATLDRRTCVACIAQDGREYKIDEPMDDHVMGRCVFTAMVPSWSQLGYADAPEPKWLRRARDPFSGENEVVSFRNARKWFNDLPEGVQQGMMGPGRWQLWKSGKVGWGDLFGENSSIVPLKALTKGAVPKSVKWYTGPKAWEPAGVIPVPPPEVKPPPKPKPAVEPEIKPKPSVKPEIKPEPVSTAGITAKTPWKEYYTVEEAEAWAKAHKVQVIPHDAREAAELYGKRFKFDHPDELWGHAQADNVMMRYGILGQADPNLRLSVQNAINRNSTASTYKQYVKRYGESPVMIADQRMADYLKVGWAGRANVHDGITYIWNTQDNIEYALQRAGLPEWRTKHGAYMSDMEATGMSHVLRRTYGEYLWDRQVAGGAVESAFDDFLQKSGKDFLWFERRPLAGDMRRNFANAFSYVSGPGSKARHIAVTDFKQFLLDYLPAKGEAKGFVAATVRPWVAGEMNVPRNGIEELRAPVEKWIDTDTDTKTSSTVKDEVVKGIVRKAEKDADFRDYVGFRFWCKQEGHPGSEAFGLLKGEEQDKLLDQWRALGKAKRDEYFKFAKAWDGPLTGINKTGDYSYAKVHEALQQWAYTSGDQDRRSLVFQKAVNDVFNLGQTNRRMFLNCSSAIEVERTENDYARLGHGYRAIVKAMYSNTQDALKKAGIEELTLYRGFRLNASWVKQYGLRRGANITGIDLQPASSFSANYYQASKFAAHYGSGSHTDMMVATVPAERVLGTCRSGWGCWSEKEVVVLDTPGQCFVYHDTKTSPLPAETRLEEMVRELGKGYED